MPPHFCVPSNSLLLKGMCDINIGILTSVNENLDMYMDITDQLAFGEMTNDDGQVNF